MKPRNLTPVAKMSYECESEAACHMVLSDHTSRLSELENTIKETLPAIGRFTEAMDNISNHLKEIKDTQKTLETKVEGVREDVGEIKVTIGTYDLRLKALEKDKENCDHEAKEKRKGYRGVILSVVATVLGAALVAWLKFGSSKPVEPQPKPVVVLPDPAPFSKKD